MPISSPVRFWLYLIFVIPSTLCGIFNLYYFLVKRALRQALSNHVIIIVLFLGLFYNLTDILWLIHHYRTGLSCIINSYLLCYMGIY